MGFVNHFLFVPWGGPDGRLGTPHPLETDGRVPLLAGWTRRVASDKLVQALALDEVPVLGTNLVGHAVGLVADQQLDGEDFVPLACTPVHATTRAGKFLNETLKHLRHIHVFGYVYLNTKGLL